MLNHRYRCIYVHIPKTGGNSVNRAFGLEWEDHKDLRRYAAELPAETFARYLKFAIVRNPWDRLLSDYNYQRKKSRPDATKLFVFAHDGAKRRFGAWIRAVLSDPHRYDPGAWGGDVSAGLHRWSPQLDWISLDGRIAVDRVLRLERLADDFPSVAETLGLRCRRLPRRNRRLHWHYSWYYDDETRDLVADYYARDIAAFGYRFDSHRLRAWQLMQQTAASYLFCFGAR